MFLLSFDLAFIGYSKDFDSSFNGGVAFFVLVCY
jgi:hypothetical protein